MIPIETEVVRIQNTIVHDLLRFVPELLLCVGIAASLFAKLFRATARVHVVPWAIGLVVVAFGIAISDWMNTEIFRGLLRIDIFSNFFRAFLLLAAALALALSRLTGLPDAEDSADYVTLVLGSTLGMMLMVTANNLIVIFLAIEMASLPGYVLAGFHKGRAKAGEAALKYVVYGAAASGILLYGMSLLAGQFGTASLPDLAARTTVALYLENFELPLATALLMVFVGLGFKLALVPFHFWMPDVFEGASAEVAAILAVASKAAAIGLLLRLAITLFATFPILHLRESIGVLLGSLAILTATYGNVAALAQTNLQRLLAYSTIAHAGYMLMAAACLKAPGTAAAMFYLVGYLPMTMGAFATVAVLRGLTGETSLDSCRGLVKRSPAVGIALAVFLFSLLGLPPLAGFVGKFQVFAAVYGTGTELSQTSRPWIGTFFWFVLGAGVVNTVIGAAYYLKILKAIAFDDPAAVDEKGNPIPLGEGMAVRIYLGLLVLAVFAVVVVWDPLAALTWRASIGMDR